MSWVLTKIDPTTFNVVSDLIAKVIAGLLLAILGFVYPQMVWTFIKRGDGVDLDGIIAPPVSFLAAARQYFRGHGQQRSGLLLLLVVIILIVAAFSHASADVFLKFEVVDVGSTQTLFLGSNPRGVSTYKLIGDRLSSVSTVTIYGNDSYDSLDFNVTDPTGPRDMALLVEQADLIVKGLSRLSFLPPLSMDIRPFAIWPGEKPKAFAGNLGIQCHGSPDYKNIIETVNANLVTLPNSTNGLNGVKIHHTNYSQALLDCDYEETTPYTTISEPPSENGWGVVDRVSFENSLFTQLDNHSNLAASVPHDWVTSFFPWAVAVLNEELADAEVDPFEPYLRLTKIETDLPVSRGFRGWIEFDDQGTKARVGGKDDWQFGRRVRDGLTFRLGHVWWMNDTMLLNGPHPGSIEFQVEYSLLTGPGATSVSTGDIQYTLSSWSRNCPFQDRNTKEISLVVASPSLIASDAISGCVIDFALECSSRFPEDVDLNANTTLEMPTCYIWDFDVAYLSGNIVVDPYMLAAYAGIATRNGGLNDLFEDSIPRIALNSLAAAYVLTREPVSGTVASTDVRASIGPPYVICMILPLLLILPLLGFVTRGAPPVPRSVWDILVLARDDDDIPRRGGSYYSYPPRRKKLAFGITVCEKEEGGDKLGLGLSFVPLTHPLPKQKSGKMPSKNRAPKQEHPKPDYGQDAEQRV